MLRILPISHHSSLVGPVACICKIIPLLNRVPYSVRPFIKIFFPPDSLTSPLSNYSSGWSHGKESLENGKYDTMKGSYYVNCAFYGGQDFSHQPHPLAKQFPEFTAPNLWPPEDSLPEFRATFEELCTLIIDTAVLVARVCDRYAKANLEGYEPGFLEHVVKTSVITKARLLHYFPPESAPNPDERQDIDSGLPNEDGQDHDSWCATHIDHGCLTGLTSAMYVDEAVHPPQLPPTASLNAPPSILPCLPGPQSPSTGLYIHARDSSIVKVSIPQDCLAFQTGEALQIITGGMFRAVPHFVRAGVGHEKGMRVARNTLAVFAQPDLEEIIDRQNGLTFGTFSREVMSRVGEHPNKRIPKK